MPLPLRTIDPSRLVARRVELGLSRAALAARAGVSPRMIFFYEEGRHMPAAPRLEQLAAALGCEVGALTGAPRGQETLVDLRYAAGLTLERTAELLRASPPGRELCVSGPKISALENGRQVRGRHWKEPEVTGRLLAPLAKAYGVPVRMVLDAWMRTRPDEPAPVPAGKPKPGPSRAALRTWESLNDRQQVYLGEIMRDDRMTETEMWMRRVQRLPVPRAAEWRKLPLALKAAPAAVGYTRLQERLRQRGLHDPGAGQTVHALERRGLLVITEDRVQHPAAGEVGRVLVEITRRGRAAARAGLGEPREQDPPAHLLSEWLWGVVARVAAAKPAGLEDDQLAAGRCSSSAWDTGATPGAAEPRAGGLRAGDGSRGDACCRVPVAADSAGPRHAAEFLDVYRKLYPRVCTAELNALLDDTA